LWKLVELGRGVDSVLMQKIEAYENDLFLEMSIFLNSYGIQQTKEQIYANMEVYDPIMDYLKIKFLSISIIIAAKIIANAIYLKDHNNNSLNYKEDISGI
jgi:hypothetical protein